MCASRDLETFKHDAIKRFGEERGMEIFAWYCQRRMEEHAAESGGLGIAEVSQRHPAYANRERPATA